MFRRLSTTRNSQLGDNKMITRLPDDGALVYGQGGGHAKYIVDPQAASAKDFRNEYNSAAQQGFGQQPYDNMRRKAMR